MYDAFARYYDLDVGLELDDIPFFAALAKQTGGPVLEVGCGTGRVLVPLARAGHEVVGLDISPAMLAGAARKIEEAGVQRRATLVEADARDFTIAGPDGDSKRPRQFGLAFVALNSFMHFVDDQDPQRVLRAIGRHLRPGGTLVLDLPNPESSLLGETGGQLIHEWTRTSPISGNQVLKLRSQRLDAVSQLLDLTFIYDEVEPDGLLRRTALPFMLRYFHPRELNLLLDACGFDVTAVYGGYELEDFHDDCVKMIYVASRRTE